MASLLLDRIINDTMHRTLRSNELYEESVLNNIQQSNNQQLKTIDSDPRLMTQEQFDNLNQMMQNVEMAQYERVFWILFFLLMVLVAAGGNIIVIYVVSTNKEMKSVTNYFLVNLSLADTMVSTLNVIFNFISMLNSHWPFGKVYCKISNFIAILSISASVFTLTAISCDRYHAIIYPLRPRMSHKSALTWILLIWTLSSALALPNAIYSTLVEDRLMSDNFATTCTMIWPDGRYPLSSYDHIYNIIVLVVTYLVPIITMAILYYKVGKELWGFEAIGENVDKQKRAIMAKKKIVKMMIVVVIIFALCWLPYHAFFVVNYYLPTIFQDSPLNYQRCYLIMYWLAMSNSMYNPIIIYFMNSKFRLEFKKVLYFICCCRAYKPLPVLQLTGPLQQASTGRPESIANNHNLLNRKQLARISGTSLNEQDIDDNDVVLDVVIDDDEEGHRAEVGSENKPKGNDDDETIDQITNFERSNGKVANLYNQIDISSRLKDASQGNEANKLLTHYSICGDEKFQEISQNVQRLLGGETIDDDDDCEKEVLISRNGNITTDNNSDLMKRLAHANGQLIDIKKNSTCCSSAIEKTVTVSASNNSKEMSIDKVWI